MDAIFPMPFTHSKECIFQVEFVFFDHIMVSNESSTVQFLQGLKPIFDTHRDHKEYYVLIYELLLLCFVINALGFYLSVDGVHISSIFKWLIFKSILLI